MLGLPTGIGLGVSYWPSVGHAMAFADSINGNDANNGLTLATAKQTLTAAEALLSTSLTALAVASASDFREMLELSQSATVRSVGTGDVPVIHGADVVTGWTAEGTANVWQKSWTHALGSSSNRFVVFEDGEMLTRVANVATCSSTPGSFVDVRASAGSPVTLKIHPTGSGDPTSNGKTYEASRRDAAIKVPSTYSVSINGPLEVGRAVGNNGSFQVPGHGNVSRVMATFGTKHAFFLGNGIATDCVVYGADKPVADELSNSSFVSYMADPTGEDYSYTRCGAFIPASHGTAYSGNGAFYAHGGAPELEYDSGSLVQCWGAGLLYGGHAGGAGLITDLGNYWRAMTFTSNASAVDYKIDQMAAYIYKTHGGMAAQVTVLNGHELENCAVYFEKRLSSDAPAMRFDGGANVVDRATLVMGGAGDFNANAFSSTASSGSVTCNSSVIAGFSGYLMNVPAGVSYTGDNNVFWADNTFVPSVGFIGFYDGNQYLSLATWQSATGQDGNSVYALVADQAAGDADALFLAWAEAAPATNLSTIGPAVGDFRLNPSAKVYDSAGNPLTGTLADGTTPITECGQQAHWDWDARQSATGPATAFPVVPDTLAEQREYISDPAGWAFA